jgi:hypothetical protein
VRVLCVSCGSTPANIISLPTKPHIALPTYPPPTHPALPCPPLALRIASANPQSRPCCHACACAPNPHPHPHPLAPPWHSGPVCAARLPRVARRLARCLASSTTMKCIRPHLQ